MTVGTMLVDATPLLGESGLRGIGKYVRDLLQGLHEVREEWAEHLTIKAALAFGPETGGDIRADLAEAAHDAFALRGSRSTAELSAQRRRAFRIANGHQCDAVHMTEPRGIPLRSTVAHVITCHDLIPLRIPKHYGGSLGRNVVLRQLWRRYYQRAERIVAISRKTSVDVHELLGVPSTRIDVIPHGLSWEAMSCGSQMDSHHLHRFGLIDRKYVFYAGFADFRKNADGMIAALAHARRQVDVTLVWAGSLPKEQRNRVLAQASALGVTDHIQLLGFVSDDELIALYRNALAHLFLSRLEGFGYSVAEAMAVGCPVIVARGSGTDEVAGDAGLCVDPDDAEAAGEHICRLSRDTEFRNKCVSAGLQRAQMFNRKEMARSYVETYLRVLGAKAR